MGEHTTPPCRQVRINFIIDGPLRAEFKTLMDHQGESMSAHFRRHIHSLVDAHKAETSSNTKAGCTKPSSPWDGMTPYALLGTGWRPPDDLVANQPWWVTQPGTDTLASETERDAPR